MPFLYLFAVLIIFQDQVPLKASREFEIITNYALQRKPDPEDPQLVFDKPEDKKKATGTDLLPYLSLQLKVKKWANDVTQVKITDSLGKLYLKKKQNDEGVYLLDMGFVDDIKDKVTSGKFIVTFLKDKKPVEQINIEVEVDGTFLINGEIRGKF